MTLRSTAIYHAKAALSLMQMRGTMDSRLERVTLGGETRFRFTYAEQGESYVVILRLNASIGGAVDATATKEANAKQSAPEQAPVAEEAAPATYQGKPCAKGHNGLRYSSNWRCVECCKADSAARYDKEAARARQAAYRARKKAANNQPNVD